MKPLDSARGDRQTERGPALSEVEVLRSIS
jgi:hypothetical protein